MYKEQCISDIRKHFKRRFDMQGIAGHNKLKIYQSPVTIARHQQKKKNVIEIRHGAFSSELPNSPRLYWVRFIKSEQLYPIKVFPEVFHDKKNINGLQYFTMGWEEFCPLSDFQKALLDKTIDTTHCI